MNRERRTRGNLLLLLSYGLLGASGVLVFVAVPSSTLVQQGGYLVVYIWGTFCLVGGLSCILGLLCGWRVFEVIGIALGISASLTWVTALALHAVKTDSALPLTAACMVTSLAGQLAHRLSVVISRRREPAMTSGPPSKPRRRSPWR